MRTILLMTLAVAFRVSAQQAHVLYPLDIGNKWEYWSVWGGSMSHQTTVLEDTIMPDGIRYTHLGIYPSGEDRFERQSADSVFSYPGQLIYLFSASLGDTIWTHLTPPGDTTDLIVVNTDSANFFGRHLRNWWFWSKPRHILGADVAYKVIDSVGVGGESSFWDDLVLHGAVIRGVQYGSITAVAGDGADPRPARFYLLQNYPNPFNPNTTISYDLPHPAHVTLRVYNMLGQEVAALVDENKTAGSHSVMFDASALPTGVYLCRFHAGSYVQTGKLLLLR